MTQLDDIQNYWNRRAQGYSLRNCDELDGEEGGVIAQRLGELMALHPGMRALDVGCGPGVLALTLARLGLAVTGADLSPEMLAHARANAAARHLTADFIQTDVTALPFADETFDVVVSRYVVWNLPDPRAAYAEWLRVLKPGATLIVWDGNHYLHCFDAHYRAHQQMSAPPPGHAERYVQGVDVTPMQRIAQSLPLSSVLRPDWDVATLRDLGAMASVVRQTAQDVTVDGVTKPVVTEFFVKTIKATTK